MNPWRNAQRVSSKTLAKKGSCQRGVAEASTEARLSGLRGRSSFEGAGSIRGAPPPPDRSVLAVRPDTLPDKQVENDLAKTVLVIRLKIEKSDSHRLLSDRADRGRLDGDHILIRSRLDHEFEQTAWRQYGRRFKRTTAH